MCTFGGEGPGCVAPALHEHVDHEDDGQVRIHVLDHLVTVVDGHLLQTARAPRAAHHGRLGLDGAARHLGRGRLRLLGRRVEVHLAVELGPLVLLLLLLVVLVLLTLVVHVVVRVLVVIVLILVLLVMVIPLVLGVRVVIVVIVVGLVVHRHRLLAHLHAVNGVRVHHVVGERVHHPVFGLGGKDKVGLAGIWVAHVAGEAVVLHLSLGERVAVHLDAHGPRTVALLGVLARLHHLLDRDRRDDGQRDDHGGREGAGREDGGGDGQGVREPGRVRGAERRADEGGRGA
jgi:hypothetical protein